MCTMQPFERYPRVFVPRSEQHVSLYRAHRYPAAAGIDPAEIGAEIGRCVFNYSPNICVSCLPPVLPVARDEKDLIGVQ
jgi:hypothetical protein